MPAKTENSRVVVVFKIYQGLINAYKLTGNEKALSAVCGFADWAADVTKDMTDKKLECEYGGMNEVISIVRHT